MNSYQKTLLIFTHIVRNLCSLATKYMIMIYFLRNISWHNHNPRKMNSTLCRHRLYCDFCQFSTTLAIIQANVPKTYHHVLCYIQFRVECFPKIGFTSKNLSYVIPMPHAKAYHNLCQGRIRALNFPGSFLVTFYVSAAS